MVLEGVVTNVAAFGAFIDIGVHWDGLAHVSQLSRNFVKDPREVVKSGDIVRVKVLEVDIPRKRISLTLRLDEETSPPRGGGSAATARPQGQRGGQHAVASVAGSSVAGQQRRGQRQDSGRRRRDGRRAAQGGVPAEVTAGFDLERAPAPSVGGMTTPQHKIGSGFGATSTADEVLAGIDLTGRLAIVTGGYSGIGLETTRALAGAGAHVVVPARRVEPAREAVGEIAEVDELDLGDLDSVARLRRPLPRHRPRHRHHDQQRRHHGLPRDPGRPGLGGAVRHQPPRPLRPGQPPVAAPRDRRRRPRGLGVLGGPPALRRSAGTTSSSSRGYDKWAAYGQAKTANVLFAVHLDKLGARRRRAGVRAAPGRDPHAAAAAPGQAGDGRPRLDRRGRHAAEPGRLQDAASRARRPRSGRRPPRSWTAWAASTSRTATSPRSPPARACGPGVREHAIDPDAGRAPVDAVGRADRRRRSRQRR